MIVNDNAYAVAVWCTEQASMQFAVRWSFLLTLAAKPSCQSNDLVQSEAHHLFCANLDNALQGVWGHEGTWRILTLDSILLLHASHFGILGGKPLVP
jgi:hypothetical protein